MQILKLYVKLTTIICEKSIHKMADLTQIQFGSGQAALEVPNRCSINFNDILKHIKSGEIELRKLVQQLMLALEEYPLVLQLNRAESRKAKELELCVLCLFRDKLVISREVQDISQCSGKSLKTIACLEADLKLKVDTLLSVDTQISTLTSSENPYMKRMENIETYIMETTIEKNNITEEIQRLFLVATELRGKKRDKQLVGQKTKDDMMNAYKQWSSHYEELAESQNKSLVKCSKDIEELNNVNIAKLNENINNLNVKIQLNIEDIAIKNDELSQHSCRIEYLRRSIEVREEKLNICCEERTKWMHYKTTQEETIEKIQKELEHYDSDVNMITKEQSEILRKATDAFDQSNKIIEKLVEENCSISVNLPDSELVIDNFICELEHSTKCMKSLHNETESLCRDCHVLDQISDFSESCGKLSSSSENEKPIILQTTPTSSYNCLNTIKNKDKLYQYNQLISRSQKIQEENDLLSQRILELEFIKQSKNEHFIELMKKKDNLCLQYDLQLKRIENYENELEDYERKIIFVQSKIESTSYKHEVLMDTEWNLKEELQQLNNHTKNQYLEHDSKIKDNKKVLKILNKLKEVLCFEKENNLKLEKSVETFLKAMECNQNGVMDAIQMSYNQEMALENEKRRLINEHDKLRTSYNITMENIKKFEKQIEIQGEKLERNYRLFTQTSPPGIPCQNNLERNHQVRSVPSNYYGFDNQNELHCNYPGYANHCFENHDSQGSDDLAFYQEKQQQTGSECFKSFNILDFAEDC